MDTKVVFIYLVLSVVIAKTKDCHGNAGDRFKRSKYFPYPPPGAVKYYRKPPMVFHPGFPGYGSPGKSIVSYTPPPNYMDEDNVHPPHITNSRPYVSKRPTNNDGLGDADIDNIVKYLSKQDLDKIIEYAGEKDKGPNELERDIEVAFNGPVDGTKYYSTKPTYGNNDQTDERFSLNGPYINGDTNKNYNPNSNYEQFANTPLESMVKYKTVPYLNDPYSQDSNISPNNQRGYLGARERPHVEQTKATNLPFNTQESIQINNTPSYLGPLQASYIRPNDRGLVDTDEEQLPKPLNLRDDTQDTQAEYSRNVEVVASPTYKVESFGDLPVMDYHSKRFSVSSYNVPHYSITSHARAPPAPAVEPAPDASAARANSDAHLKAVRIWTHKSNGAAYTLHNDGSLSVERPLRPYRSP